MMESITESMISHFEVSDYCREPAPCRHDCRITLADGRQAHVEMNGFQIYALMQEFGRRAVVIQGTGHFAPYGNPAIISTHYPTGQAPSSAEVIHSIVQPIFVSTSSTSKEKWKLPFTYDQVMAKAEEQFVNHLYKDSILKKIELHLKDYNVFGKITLQGHRMKNPSEKDTVVIDAIHTFFAQEDIFPSEAVNIYILE